MKHYPNIFTPGKLGTKVAKNRIYMAPMGDNMATEDGSVSEQVIAYYQERAKGGVGTIVPGVVCVDYPRGKSVACQLRLDQIKYINGWSKLADAVHRYGTLLLPQLHHAGISTDILTTEGLDPVTLNEDIDTNQKQLVGNKPRSKYEKSDKKLLTIEDIKEIEEKFIKSAVYAQWAGCDGVELHAGPHYLIGNFLMPGTNQRADEYGGSLENRLRFAVNIIRGIRERCGRNFVIGIRMTLHWEDCEENTIIAKSYVDAGADFLDASFPAEVTRQTQVVESSAYPEGARLALSRNLMGKVDVPVFINGAFKTPDFVDKALAEKSADFVGLGRPLICDPYWLNKAKAGKANEIKKCLSCMECANGNQYSRGIKCGLNPEMGREYAQKLEPVSVSSKKVVIVGGGIAGMQAAITATKRGHEVVILEKTDKLGGQMHLAGEPPTKGLIKEDVVWFAEECARLGVDIRLNTEGTMELIKELNPDHVMLAMGSIPFTAPIKGVENTVQAWDILGENVEAPKDSSVVIIGGGIVGCETAKYLEERGNKITIIEKLPEMAPDLFWMLRAEMLEDFVEMGIGMVNVVDIKSISDSNVVVYEKDGQEVTVESDMVVLCTGQISVASNLANLLEEADIDYTVIGDGKRPGKFMNATTDGYFAALNL